MTAYEICFAIMVFGMFVLIAAMERRANKQEEALRMLMDAHNKAVTDTTTEFRKMGEWGMKVNEVLTRQCMINGEVQKRVFGDEG